METKRIPCTKVTPETWKYITNKLKSLGYKSVATAGKALELYNILIIDNNNYLGYYNNYTTDAILGNRYFVEDIEEFLKIAAQLINKEYTQKKNTFTIDDIKPGMVVELRNGSREIVLSTENNTIFTSRENDYSSGLIETYHENLTHVDNKVYDIVKVYSIKSFCTILNVFNKEYLSIIWEKQKLQISMKEIADKFGVNENEIEIIDYENK